MIKTKKAGISIFVIMLILLTCQASGIGRIINSRQTLCIKEGTEEHVVIFSLNGFNILDKNGKEIGKYQLNGQTIMSSCITDLNGNEGDSIILLTKLNGTKYGNQLLVLSLVQTSDENFQIVQDISQSFKDKNPWKVQSCDVDGDGRKEISIGVYKSTPFNPDLAKRPFIYSTEGSSITPKWLGSRLTNPFDDYIFADINEDGKDELISIECLGSGKKEINSYCWDDFGFTAAGNSKEFDDIRNISAKINSSTLVCEIGADIMINSKWRYCSFYFRDFKNGHNEGEIIMN